MTLSRRDLERLPRAQSGRAGAPVDAVLPPDEGPIDYAARAVAASALAPAPTGAHPREEAADPPSSASAVRLPSTEQLVRARATARAVLHGAPPSRAGAEAAAAFGARSRGRLV